MRHEPLEKSMVQDVVLQHRPELSLSVQLRCVHRSWLAEGNVQPVVFFRDHRLLLVGGCHYWIIPAIMGFSIEDLV